VTAEELGGAEGHTRLCFTLARHGLGQILDVVPNHMAIAARGNAYLIGYFDDDGRLVRDVKMLKGAVFFEHLYDYYPSGKLRRVSVTNPKGVMTTREYPDGALPGFFW